MMIENEYMNKFTNFLTKILEKSDLLPKLKYIVQLECNPRERTNYYQNRATVFF